MVLSIAIVVGCVFIMSRHENAASSLKIFLFYVQTLEMLCDSQPWSLPLLPSLLDRLAFDVITLPPLRARAEDIMVLAQHFAVGMIKELGGDYFHGFSQNVERMLVTHTWPGNVRELKNVVERAVYQCPDRQITRLVFNPFESPYRLNQAVNKVDAPRANSTDSAPLQSAAPAVDLSDAETLDFKTHVQDYEIDLLKQAMKRCQFNQRKAADFLQMSYHQLRGYLRKYDLLG